MKGEHLVFFFEVSFGIEGALFAPAITFLVPFGGKLGYA